MTAPTPGYPFNWYFDPTQFSQAADGKVTFAGGASGLVKPADTSRATNAVASADPDLTTSLAAGTYALDAYVTYTAAGAGGLKGALFASQAIPTALYALWSSQAGTSTVSTILPATTPGTVITVATQIDNASGNAGAFWMKGKIIIPSTTTLLFTWAQQNSNGTPTVLQAGSWMTLTKLA